MLSKQQLSKADSRVLAQVFDPESAPTRAEVLIDPDLPPDRHIHDTELLEELRAREKGAIAIIEYFEKSEPATATREASYSAALRVLDAIIGDFPNYAAARNNRAQLRRWRFGDRHTLCQKKNDSDAERSTAGVAAVHDLGNSIALASPARQQDAVSPSQGRLLAQAHTQLGALYYAAFKDLDCDAVMEIADIDGSEWGKVRFEEEASRSFYLGGLYGNEVAKALAVHTNPHAKLCGSIVKEAMRKEMAAAQF